MVCHAVPASPISFDPLGRVTKFLKLGIPKLFDGRPSSQSPDGHDSANRLCLLVHLFLELNRSEAALTQRVFDCVPSEGGRDDESRSWRVLYFEVEVSNFDHQASQPSRRVPQTH